MSDKALALVREMELMVFRVLSMEENINENIMKFLRVTASNILSYHQEHEARMTGKNVVDMKGAIHGNMPEV